MRDQERDPFPDGGALFAKQTKTHPKASDYFGEIAINMKDKTNVRMHGDLMIVKLGGWKKTTKAGKTFLSLAVDRYVPKTEGRPQSRQEEDEADPF